MQGYILPIVLACLLAVPILWRIGSDVTEPATAVIESPDDPETQTTAADDDADDAEAEARKIRTFSLGDSELQLDFSAAEDLISRERDRAIDLHKAGFNKDDED